MDSYDKVTRPIKEVNYLRVENVARYRLIIRFFYREYEKLHYLLDKDDVYEMMREYPDYEDYTFDQCQQDLQSLVDWGNLIASQDNQKVRTIEDFKNRKFRYQLSDYSVEIERMTIRLENLSVEGASLEPTLLERIYNTLKEFDEIKAQEPMDIKGWLDYIIDDFEKLNKNYQDYIKTLNGAKAEELMKTEAFLVYKDTLVAYLRTFVKSLQETGTLIALQLESMNKDELEDVFQKAADYEMTIPRLDKEPIREDIYQRYFDRWQSLYNWFVGNKEGINEMDRLNDITNDIITKMTRYAQRIVEMNNRGSNRKEQYDYIAKMFMKCQDINEAHCLSAYVFGVSDCLHLDYIKPRATEDIYSGVYEEKPSTIEFDSHSMVFHKKAARKPARDYSYEKEMQLREAKEQIEERNRKVNALIHDNKIIFKDLPELDEQTRKTLLLWLSKAMEREDKSSKTDEGRSFYIDESEADEYCVVTCEDGDFMMPSYQMIFAEVSENEQ